MQPVPSERQRPNVTNVLFVLLLAGLALGAILAFMVLRPTGGGPVFAVTAINAEYMAPLYHTSTGHKMMITGLVMIGIGSLILRKIVSFRG